MTDIAYMRRSIDAAFRLALRDQRAWNGFDLTADGFFRSFAAILIVMPLNVLIEISSIMRRRSGLVALPVIAGFCLKVRFLNPWILKAGRLLSRY